MVVIVQAEAGGYDAETGWSPSSHRPVEPVASPVEDRDEVAADNAVADDPASVGQPRWYPLARHLADVEREVGLILDHLAPEGLADGHKDAACLAGRLHDIGKVHDAFQGMLLSCADGDEEEQRAAADAGRPLAKSAGHKRGRYEDQWLRKAFRHELASALALLEGCHPDLDHTAEPDLVVYLVAAHHGRVRLGFRPLPDEATREKDGRRVALGVVDGDDMPADTIPGFGLKAVSLSLGPMGIGGGGLRRSWADLAFSLRDRPDLGPFRLGFLEAVVRMADWRASRAIDEPAKEAAHARP
jgi:CRISPR-associated endonuclease/helicase Cas3